MTEKKLLNISLVPLDPADREKFIKDAQESFKYGATEEFGMRDNHLDKEGQTLSRKLLEESLNNEKSTTFRIVLDKESVGGVILKLEKEKKTGELDILFVNSNAHSKGIGTSTWMTIEKMYPEIELWITHTPYFEKRNIHFYINRLGFHAVEFIHNRNRPKKNPDEFLGLKNFSNLKRE